MLNKIIHGEAHPLGEVTAMVHRLQDKRPPPQGLLHDEYRQHGFELFKLPARTIKPYHVHLKGRHRDDDFKQVMLSQFCSVEKLDGRHDTFCKMPAFLKLQDS